MSKLNVSSGFKLPMEAASDAIAIVGRRGRGKTTTAVVLVEEIHANGGRFVVADPVGVWWGLKSTRDGKGKGIPVIVMGGEHADVPLEETGGKVIADFVIDPTSPSVVLDFRGFRKAQITRFMVDFLEQLYHKNRQPLHVVLDEADQFAPQRVMGETARMVGACEDVCKMGRARGLFPMLITQRPAALNKNVLTQAGLLVTHQLTGPQDRKALDDWIRANAEDSEREKFIETVPTLPRGKAWFWWPENGIFEQVQVRDRKTFDSSATPKPGEKKVQPKVLAEVDLEVLKEKISATIEKAKLADPKELQRQIVALKKELAAKPVPVIHGEKTKIVKVPAFTDAQVKRMETLLDKMVKEAERHGGAMSMFWSNFNEIGDSFQKALETVATEQHGYKPPERPKATVTPIRRPVAALVGNTEGGPMGAGECAVLTAAAQHEGGITREQATVLTGYKTSTRNAYIQRLRNRGYVVEQGELVVATEAGVSALGPGFEPLPTGDALREHWLRDLPEGERKIFEAVCGVYPKAAEREWLSEVTGYKTSTRNAYIQRLGNRRIITVNGSSIRASELVFS